MRRPPARSAVITPTSSRSTAGHYQGRKALTRRLVRACVGTALEINAHPDGDAHSVIHLATMRYGVGTAQRGRLTRDDVINTWPQTRLRRFLRKGRGAA